MNSSKIIEYPTIFPILVETVLTEIENRLKTSNQKDLTEKEYLKLHSLFDETFLQALNIIDNKKITLYQSDCCSLLEIIGYKNIYKLFPDINYCSCDDFYDQVIKNQNSYTCKHVLAGKLSLFLNKFQIQIIKKDELIFLIKQIL